jgi:hypothetical protein
MTCWTGVRIAAFVVVIGMVGHVPNARAAMRAIGHQDKSATNAEAAAVAGKWRLFVNAPNLSGGSVLEIKVDAKDKNGKKIVGTLTVRQMGEVPIKGEFSKDKIKFSITIDTGNVPIEVDFEGKLKGDGSFAGTAIFGMTDIEWTARRIDDAAAPVVLR